MKKYIVTPISHLFSNKINTIKILESSDYLELRHYKIKHIKNNKILFHHSDLQLNFKFTNKEISDLKTILNKYKNIKYVSFHVASCYRNPVLNKLNIFEKGNNKIKSDQMIENAKFNMKILKNYFPKINISIENNNYYRTGAYEIVCDPYFLSDFINSLNISFLFDYSHSLISSYNLNMNFKTYFQNLPINKINQIHLSRPIIKDNFYYDSHFLPIIDNFTKDLLSLKNLKFITVEYYKNVNNLLKINEKLKSIIL